MGWNGRQEESEAKHHTNASTSAILSQMQAEAERGVCIRFSWHFFFLSFRLFSASFVPIRSARERFDVAPNGGTEFLLYCSSIFAIFHLRPARHAVTVSSFAKISFLANDTLWLGSTDPIRNRRTKNERKNYAIIAVCCFFLVGKRDESEGFAG